MLQFFIFYFPSYSGGTISLYHFPLDILETQAGNACRKIWILLLEETNVNVDGETEN